MTTPSLNPDVTPPVNTPAPTQTPNQPPFDLQALLGDELKGDPMLAPFKTVVDLAKSYKDTKSLVGADTMRKLTKHATEKDRAEFLRKAFDVPAELDKYEVTAPKGLAANDEFFGEMKKKAFELGLPASEVNAFVNRFYEFNEQKIADMTLSIENKAKEEWDGVRKRYGQAFEQKMALAQATLKEFAGKDLEAVQAEMVSKGWQSSPWLAELLIRVGEFRFKEDQIKGMTRSGKLALDPKEAEAKISEIYGNRDHPYHHNMHPNHGAALKEVEELFKIQHAKVEAG